MRVILGGSCWVQTVSLPPSLSICPCRYSSRSLSSVAVFTPSWRWYQPVPVSSPMSLVPASVGPTVSSWYVLDCASLRRHCSFSWRLHERSTYVVENHHPSWVGALPRCSVMAGCLPLLSQTPVAPRWEAGTPLPSAFWRICKQFLVSNMIAKGHVTINIFLQILENFY